jgi:hypothetical protein
MGQDVWCGPDSPEFCTGTNILNASGCDIVDELD